MHLATLLMKCWMLASALIPMFANWESGAMSIYDNILYYDNDTLVGAFI